MLSRLRSGRTLRGVLGRTGAALLLCLASGLGGVAGVVGAAGTAHAGVTPCYVSYVCLTVSTPGQAGGSSGGGGGGGGSACSYGGMVMACYIPGIGWLSAADGCYYERMNPQPPAGDPLWQGNPPGTGAVYVQTCPLQGGRGLSDIWMPTPPPTPAQVSPADLARIAANQIGFFPPRVSTAPAADTRHSGLVGMPVWFWLNVANGYTAHTWATSGHPLTASASVPGLTVWADAFVSSVTWEAGDGLGTDCHGSLGDGISFGHSESLACTHVYQLPKKTYGVDAIVHWEVRWYQNGAYGGEFPIDGVLTPAVQLQIEELQVLN